MTATLDSLRTTTSPTGYRHVTEQRDSPRSNRFRARIRKTSKSLGYYPTPREAAEAVLRHLNSRGNAPKTRTQSLCT